MAMDKPVFNPKCSCALCTDHDAATALSDIDMHTGSKECLARYIDRLEQAFRWHFQGDPDLIESKLTEALMEGYY